MAVEHQEDSQILLEQIMPQIAAQLRGAMGNIHTALTRLVPEEMPEGEGSTGQSAAILCQSYYRLLRLVNNLSAAPLISQTEPLETKNVELVAWLTELMHCAQPLVAHAGVRLTLRCSPDGPCGGHPPQLSGAAVVESAVQCGEVHALRRRGHGDAAGRSGTSAADGGRQRRGHPPGAAGAPLRRLSGEAADAASPTGSGAGPAPVSGHCRGHGGRLLLQSGRRVPP